MKPRSTLLALALTPLVLLSACRQEAHIEPSGRSVRIGVIAPLSGPDRELGLSGLQGVELAVQLHPLLDNGDRVELVVLDDESRPQRAAQVLGDLAEQQVVAVLVLSKSNSALALTEDADRHRLPIVATIATHPDLTTLNPHLVQLSFDDAFQATVAAMFLRDELLLEHAAVIYQPDDPHSLYLATAFAGQFKEANGTVAEQLALASVEPALAEHLEALRDQGVELLYVPVPAEGVLRVAQALEDVDWRPVVMAADGLLSEMLLKHVEKLDLVDGLIATDIYSTLLARTPYGKEIAALYRTQNGRRGSTLTMLGSEGASLLLESLNRSAPPYAPQQVQRALRSVQHFEGFTGTIAIGRNGKAIRPVYVNTIRGRTLEFIVKVY